MHCTCIACKWQTTAASQRQHDNTSMIKIVFLWCSMFGFLHLFTTPKLQTQEALSRLVPSQWGMVHLFDLCLWFGLIDTALALAMRGVEGCVLEDHQDLGPFSRDVSRSATQPCRCHGWDTCRYCCWAFPVEQGIWMEDWDECLDDYGGSAGAIAAAQKAAATPLTCHAGPLQPRHWSSLQRFPEGDGTAAGHCHLDRQPESCRQLVQEEPAAAPAGMGNGLGRWRLWAGADFRDLMVKDGPFEDVPFPQAFFLDSKLEDWQEIRHLLPGCHDLWRPTHLDTNELGEFFLERSHVPGGGMKLSPDKIHAAEDAGLDLQFSYVEVFCDNDGTSVFVTLLDIALWCGQPDWAEACVDGGIELKGGHRTLAWHKRVLRGESLRGDGSALNVVPSEAQIAAEAAGRAWLKRLWKSHSSQKGMVLYQMMLKMFKRRSFPMCLVQETLSCSMPVPKIMDQLDLWEHVGRTITKQAHSSTLGTCFVFHCLLPRVEIASGNHSSEP